MQELPWVHGKLRKHGARLTVPRILILDILYKTKKHLSAEDIYLAVHKLDADIGMTTVYRTLDLLVEINLVLKFDFGDGKLRYELIDEMNGQHHHHLVCTKCKKVIDYTGYIDDAKELIAQTEKGLSNKFNFNITGHNIQFYGLCEKCKEGGD